MTITKWIEPAIEIAATERPPGKWQFKLSAEPLLPEAGSDRHSAGTARLVRDLRAFGQLTSKAGRGEQRQP